MTEQHSDKKSPSALTAPILPADSPANSIAGISHDLRTPLNSILGMTALLLKDDRLLNEHKEMLGVIQTAGQRLLGLASNVLDIAKIESGKVTGPTDVILKDRVLPVVILVWMLTSAAIILFEPLRTFLAVE